MEVTDCVSYGLEGVIRNGSMDLDSDREKWIEGVYEYVSRRVRENVRESSGHAFVAPVHLPSRSDKAVAQIK